MKDYYQVLGVGPKASATEIKHAYRELAMQYHPDRNRENPESEERLKAVNEAYHILGNEQKRRYYDVQMHQPLNRAVFDDTVADDAMFDMLWKFSSRGVGGRPRGCRGKGFGRKGCGRCKG